MDGFFYALFEKRRLVIAGIVIVADLLLMSLLVSVAQARHASLSQQRTTANSAVAPQTYSSPNVVTDALAMMLDDATQASDTANRDLSNSVASVVIGADHGCKLVGHGTIASASFVGRTVADTFLFTMHGIGSIVTFAGRTIGGGFMFVGRTIGASAVFIGRTIGGIPKFALHAAHVSSLIKAPDHTPIPIITQLREQQAAIIQSDTVNVVIPVANGSGGACDAGKGNGGYPMVWCNAPMDTIATVPYSSDPINRECTSYAFWYFTSVEGHADFHVTDDAKYWAYTSNYPTHTTPVVGAIAVETAGAYGHVAIVQALPGQQYDGEAVPAGYVLVSEMNYDWAGHFRYSYSPLSKFSAYIYP